MLFSAVLRVSNVPAFSIQLCWRASARADAVLWLKKQCLPSVSLDFSYDQVHSAHEGINYQKQTNTSFSRKDLSETIQYDIVSVMHLALLSFRSGDESIFAAPKTEKRHGRVPQEADVGKPRDRNHSVKPELYISERTHALRFQTTQNSNNSNIGNSI